MNFDYVGVIEFSKSLYLSHGFERVLFGERDDFADSLYFAGSVGHLSDDGAGRPVDYFGKVVELTDISPVFCHELSVVDDELALLT